MLSRSLLVAGSFASACVAAAFPVFLCALSSCECSDGRQCEGSDTACTHMAALPIFGKLADHQPWCCNSTANAAHEQ